jgi:hypothetical protein
VGLSLELGSVTPVLGQAVPEQSQKTGEQLYGAACAACHGADGRGVAITTVGFEIPLPDFTDCQFAPREPNEDWAAVIHNGGPARGFDRMMPAFGEALTTEEIDRILDHVRAFCRDDDWPRGELNLPRALVTGKAYPEDEAVLTVSIDAENSDSVTSKMVYERRIGPRNQVEAAVPFNFAKQTDGSWRGGVGDIALSAKRAMFHSFRTGSIFSVAGEVILPTGDDDVGLGSGTTMFEPYLAFGQILPRSGFLQLQSGMEIPVDRDRADEVFWRAALGTSFTQGRFGRAWSPMVEFLGVRELEAGQKAHWDILPQVQVTLNTRQHVIMNVGVRVPMNDHDSRSTQVVMYVLWDWFDGGFLEGW